MPQLDRPLVKERARRLREKGEQALARHLAREVGKVRLVLAEEPTSGRTPQFTEVKLQSAHVPGSLASVRLTGIEGSRLVGSAIG